MMKQRSSLVIPAYNEARRIGDVLCAYHPVAEEVIVVANGCTDSTAQIVRDFAEAHGGVRLLLFPERLGKGGAVLEGFKAASNQLVGFVDSDLSVPPEELRRLFHVLEEGGFGAVIGSRRMEESRIEVRQPFARQVMSRVFNLLIRALFGLRFRDTQCGAKVFRKEAVEAVLDSMGSGGYEFDVELLWRLEKAGFTIKEVGIEWRHSGESKFSLAYGPAMVLRLLLLRLSMGKY
ncbi:MAG: glycosyltransferase family 2 protein [Methanobacteriota archaeon]|nr:MAG: glycosyltransferase family 2 protein [Euryarchaeota archaeon]